MLRLLFARLFTRGLRLRKARGPIRQRPELEAFSDRILPTLSTNFTGGILTVTSDAVGDSATVTSDGTNLLLNTNAIAGSPTVSNTTQI